MIAKRFLVLLLIALFALPLLVSAQEITPIAYGQVITGEISDTTPSVSYSFSGTQGDVIVARMTATGGSGLDSFLRLIDPQGNDFYTDDDSGGMTNALMGPVTLPETGTYTLIASSCCDAINANTSGTYELVVEQAVVPALAVNQPVAFELSQSSTVAFFSLSNDAITTKLARAVVNVLNSEVGNWHLSVEVRGSIGSYFYSDYAPIGSTTFVVDPIIADLAGGASLVVVRAYSDNPSEPMFAPNQVIQAELLISEMTATPITLNTPITGTLNDANPTGYYSFDATMGDLLNLAGTQIANSQPINITVYGTGGFSITGASTISYGDVSNAGSFTIDPLRTNNTGTYYVVVNRAVYGAPEEAIGTTSDFSLTLGATATPMLTAGTPINGIFNDPNKYEDVYRYQATANQTIRVTIKSLNAGYAPAFDIQGEAFESPETNITNVYSAVPGVMIYELTLYYDSVYIIRVRNGIAFIMEDTPGEYSVQIDVIQ